ncbi:MAG: class I mannose-6-phosphate isomerase [Chakrabartia sp.]
MSAILLSTIRVEKPWGRHTLWPGFGDAARDEPPVGEIWFDTPPGKEPDLMIKYLFTSERLSIQVHPDDQAARASGYARGKEEAWLILAAEPTSTIAIGTTRPVSHNALRAACLDGSIETLMDWKPVKDGDFIYLPAGTIHAIGAGITLIEVQQNIDLTYRLYDYGRPRELHLEAGIAVSHPVPFVINDQSRILNSGRTILTEGGKFAIERWQGNAPVHQVLGDSVAWFVPVRGVGTIGDAHWSAGQCWQVSGDVAITAAGNDADMLFAYTGPVRS